MFRKELTTFWMRFLEVVELYTLKEMVDIIANNEKADFDILFGDFLDYFYSPRRTDEERYNLIKDEPVRYDNISRKDYAFLAATAHSLALEYGLKVPDWVADEFYFLEDPYFALDAKGDLRIVLLLESPPCFRIRNLFVSENVLSRV